MGVRCSHMSIFLKLHQVMVRNERSFLERGSETGQGREAITLEHETVKHAGGLVKVCTQVLHFSTLRKNLIICVYNPGLPGTHDLISGDTGNTYMDYFYSKLYCVLVLIIHIYLLIFYASLNLILIDYPL